MSAEKSTSVEKDLDRDPISGERDADPVAVGGSTATAGVAGAAIGSVAGPIGTVVGALIGAVAGSAPRKSPA